MMAVSAHPALLEREVELPAIDEKLDDALRGVGQAGPDERPTRDRQDTAAPRASQPRLVIFNCVPLLPGYRWHLLARIWRTRLVGELATKAGLRLLSRAATATPGPMPPP